MFLYCELKYVFHRQGNKVTIRTTTEGPYGGPLWNLSKGRTIPELKYLHPSPFPQVKEVFVRCTTRTSASGRPGHDDL